MNETTLPAQISTGISGSNVDSGQGSVTSPASAPSPVSVISTNQGKDALSTYQDQHASDMASISSAADSSDAANKGVTAANQSKDAATFAKSMGGLTPEEASALKIDTSGYDFNSAANMYVPKTGISADPTKAPSDIAAKASLDKVNAAFAVQSATNDGATANLVSKLQATYTDIINQQTTINKSADALETTSGINKGSARYAQDVNGGILTATANAGLQKLVDLQTKEANAIAEAESANAKNQLSLFADKQKEVNDIRTQQAATLKSLQDEATKMQSSIQTAKTAVATTASVKSLIGEGITDPEQILQKLNYDESGNKTGSLTPDDVTKILQSMAPGGDISKLSGITNDFFVLKGHNQLPSSITSLPEDMQLSAYISQQKTSATASATAAAGKPITLSSAKSLGLPLSTVGMTQNDIIDSFKSSAPPHWFTEKLQTEKNMTVIPSVIQSTWDTYRQSFNSTSKGSTTSTKTTAAGKTPPPSLVGSVRALKSKNATAEEINQFISLKGYNFDANDPAFK